MRAISVVGFKNSGKTTLSKKILKLWEENFIMADFLKFSSSGFDKEKTDTAKMVNSERSVFGVSAEESMITVGRKLSLPFIVASCQNKLLLVEGGKSEFFFPRVVCARTKEEFEELDCGLAIASYSYETSEAFSENIPHFTPDTVNELAQLMVEKSFYLATLNCRACGKENCHELAKEIVAGEASPLACVPLHGKKDNKNREQSVEITVGGNVLPLNPFVGDIIKGAIEGMLGELKGFTRGSSISINIKD